MAKSKLTKEMVDKAIELGKSGLNNKDIIKSFQVDESTFYKWLKNPKTDQQRRLRDGLKQAETDLKQFHLNVIINAGREGKWQASAWYLERKYSDEFAGAKARDSFDYKKPKPKQDPFSASLEESVMSKKEREERVARLEGKKS